ncbi:MULTISPECIES: biosynthetic peptidoglycan transglycosylase [unclassified Variovorax]|uniref:biosynthetic peptidoglycan transglycosylase n=1 Tax=unclassified Variovorax TaxID=663243 RepID=UPI00076CD86B|nr:MULTISPECIES: biosynthetic peptidoglycan transglycosylase [unclassified Variovorax]KWT96887.1 Monofunctional biosynthetic peptidoglycan transglycosylase [Variovorax sp. WDL1]
MKKALLFLLFGLLALVLTAAVAIYLVVKLALAPGPGEWPTRIKAGPFALDVGVPTAIRLATSSWFAPRLAGRTFQTGHGPVRVGWNEAAATLELDCAPCMAEVPALGNTPLRLDNLRFTARRDAGSLNGVLEATPAATTVSSVAGDNVLRARWDGKLTQKSLQIHIDAPEAPIARWYSVLAPAIPELQRAKISGTLALRAQLDLPVNHLALHPRIEQFSVEGLGTEALLDARTSCGPPSRLAPDSWLARAVIAAEDQRFFSHPGYDLTELTAALDVNQKAGQVERGGSTLSQQLARLVVTGSERSAERKLRELLYAVEMEQTLGKPRILQLYLDNAPWGPGGLCGAEAAARRYFKRSARNLEPAQAVWLASMLNNPGAALDKWQRDGRIDGERAKWVAEGLRGLTRGQRESLQRNIAAARFAPPP